MWWCTCARAGASCVKQIFGGFYLDGVGGVPGWCWGCTWVVLGVYLGGVGGVPGVGVFTSDIPSRQAQDAEGSKVRESLDGLLGSWTSATAGWFKKVCAEYVKEGVGGGPMLH